PISSLFSMMRNDCMSTSRSLMPMQIPEKPEPTISTSTLVTGELEEKAPDAVMRGPLLPCWTPLAQRARGKSQRFLEAIDGLRESDAGRAARHGERRARFLIRRKRLWHGRVRRGAWNHRARLHRCRRESEAAEVRRDRRTEETRAGCADQCRRDSSAPMPRRRAR